MSILQAESLLKRYARRTVVNDVSLEIGEGEIIGLLGPNGAGKTTTFRMICGMTKPDGGRVLLRGEDVTSWPMYVRASRGGMGYLPQQSSVFGKLSAEDNLRGIMQLLGMNRQEQKARTEELLEQFKITHVRRTAAGRLSGGERRRLEIARCLISNPQLIMLDEPFAGIDPVTVQNVQVIIRELAQQGISILITDHAAREILQITDRTYVVSEGTILCSGTTDQIVQHEEVKRKYLGEIDVVKERVFTPLTPLVIREKKADASAPPRLSPQPTNEPSAAKNLPVPVATRFDQSDSRPEPVQVRPVSRRVSQTAAAPFRATDLDT
jgi:lipopolysaccharide export system ATP-binding protein